MKYYHMIIAKPDPLKFGDPDPATRREYISPKQGSAPAGWICIGVCGYHETPNDDRRSEKCS